MLISAFIQAQRWKVLVADANLGIFAASICPANTSGRSPVEVRKRSYDSATQERDARRGSAGFLMTTIC